jgi:glycosyltransferase involved in cell wall biosynthesis
VSEEGERIRGHSTRAPRHRRAERPLTVLFVGAFRESAQDGAVGGSLYASRTLIDSPITEHVRWILVDSTMRSVLPPPLPVRATRAARRIIRFAVAVARPSTDATLIFTGSHLGFLEKGLMALISKAVGKPVLLSPRSGLMIDAVARSRLQRRLVRAVLSRCDLVICQGRTWKDFYRDLTGLPEERLVTIPNWIKLSDYAGVRSASRPQGPTVFLYLGWVEPYKGIFDLIRAVDGRRAELQEARVVVCGKGSALPEAQRLTEALDLGGMISFKGWVLGDRKRAALAEADVLVLPSHREGMPNALLEAMASGLPVIATGVGSIPDVVINGGSGLLVPPADPVALGGALARLAANADERRRMGRAAQQRVARDHDVSVAWPRLLGALHQVVAESRGPREGRPTSVCPTEGRVGTPTWLTRTAPRRSPG